MKRIGIIIILLITPTLATLAERITPNAASSSIATSTMATTTPRTVYSPNSTPGQITKEAETRSRELIQEMNTKIKMIRAEYVQKITIVRKDAKLRAEAARKINMIQKQIPSKAGGEKKK